MTRISANSCSQCAKLQERLQEMQTRLTQLEQAHRDSTKTIRELKEQLAEARKDSTTSAKPPSSDIVKPPKPTPDPDAPKRSIGGQPGHPAHFRKPFPPEQVTTTIPHRLTHCPDCGHCLEATAQPPHIVQQLDLRPLTFTIEEHHSYVSWCPHCQKGYAGPLPGHIIKGGL